MHNTNRSAEHRLSFIGMLKLMRPKQWVKNTFVLAPLIFSERFTDFTSVMISLVATLLFCLGSSAVYILNDFIDIERDRCHPIKSKKRPLASGQVTKVQALFLLCILYFALFLVFFLQPDVTIVIFSYVVLNIAYTFFLKYQPVIDIFTIAAGFVLRVYTGATALSVPVSSWMFITTLCLALYLAAVKRKKELIANGPDSQNSLEQYSIPIVNKFAEMASIGALLFYSLFVINDKPELVSTIPFVLFGIFRFWFIVEIKNEGESPTDVLLSDWQLLLTIVLWITFCALILLTGGLKIWHLLG